MKLILPFPYFRGIGILACMLLIFSSLKSQVPSACPIGAAMEPKSNSELNSTSSGREINFLPFTGWSGKQNVKFSDDQKAMITLGSIDRSRVFVGDNFKFQIPAGATINGIMLMVEGLSDNYKNIDEVLISLTDAYGEVKGQNKSNQAKLQKAWNKSTSGEDHTWMYGSSSDTWGTTWSSDEINDSDFGFNIQIRNIDATPIKVAIDQITILVYYTPAYSFCDDNCLTFHIDKFENYGSYTWEEVKGFTLVSKSYNQQTIDLKVGNASFGLHQICVNVYDKQGRFAARCCRQFLYPDCSASEIRGQVWLDQNDNNLFESYEGILPNTPIILFTNSNIPIDTVLSNDAGKYVFTKIIPGSYYLKVPALSNKSFVLKNNINPDRNSDITGSFGPGTTDVIHVEIGKIYENIDFGYKPLVTLGDYVWEDKNYNGIQDANEKGIPEVQVKLFTSDHKLKDSTTTDSLGKYTFSNIAANTYYLIFSAPVDFRPTWKNNSVLLNSKIDASGKTEMYTFKNSEIKLDIDAGFFITGSIGDLAWEDKNGDGLLNMGEVPVGGVKISLIGTSGNGLPIEKSTTTDSMGRYLFTYLLPGQYRLVVMKPDGFEFTTPDAGDDDLDSDVINGFVNGIEIMSGSSFHNIDIGLYRFASLGDMVWEDLNANGIMEEGEPGIPNVKALLSEVLRDKIVLIDSTTTNDLGKYYFENLKPGNYKVDFTLPSNFNPTLKDIGNDDSIDSDVSGNSIAPISLMSGQINNSYDAGYYKYGSIGDFVWEDFNANGIQDLSESGIVEVVLTLTGKDGFGNEILRRDTTDNNGKYLFENLIPGQYSLQISDVSPMFVPTKVDQGFDDLLDSDSDLGFISGIILQSGKLGVSNDFGFVRELSIGDFVWNDLNANGIQEVGEPGLPNVTLKLQGIRFDGIAVDKTATTDNNGLFTFDKLLPGKYTISIEILPGYSATKTLIGNDPSIDSNLPLDSNNFSFELTNSAAISNFDFGLVKLGELLGYVYEDENCDNIQQPNELGIAGISIQLSGIDFLGTEVQKTVVTDSLGYYLFNELKPGIYNVMVIQPSGFESTITLNFEITIDQNNLLVIRNIPLFRRASIGNFVWFDTNNNGLQDITEAGVLGVNVTISGSTLLAPKETVTDSLGKYIFTDLKPGSYSLQFSQVEDNTFTTPKVGTNDAVDSDVDSTGLVTGVVLTSGQSKTDIDAGYISTATASIGDFVWEDLNGNGTQDVGEPGIAGVTVNLTGLTTSGKTINVSTTTNAEGKYSFTSLAQGKYKVTFGLPTTYFFANQGVGTERAIDSDADVMTGETAEFDVSIGQIINTIDAGMYRYGSIGDLVWFDTNNNGLQDVGESGIPGVMLTISGSTLLAPKETVTDSLGKYIFTDLKPGSYSLQFAKVADNTFTTTKVGTNDAIDSDVDSTGLVTGVVLTSGQTMTDIDAGYISTATATIGDFVWEDLNGNGLQESGESGIAGVTVTLTGLTTSGKTINASTTTNTDGKYSFTSLAQGKYKVTFGLPITYFFTNQGVGGERANDSDVNAMTGETAEFDVSIGQIINTIDAGMYRFGSIGDFVWYDTNNNGVQDAGEAGISNVSVTISGSTLVSPKVSMTDSLGKYIFTDLKPGSFSLEFAQVADNTYTSTKVGSNDTIDSDVDSTGLVTGVVLTSGQARTNVDAGYISTATASIGDFVWDDLNGNGLQESGEPGIAGVTVNIKGESGSVVNVQQTTESDAAGRYSFNGLIAGMYSITFIKPIDFQYTQIISSQNSINSDADPITGKTSLITLVLGQNNIDIDAGFYRFGSIGDFVWNDSNGNGLQDSTELGISGIEMNLLSEDGSFISSIITDSIGYYKFTNLAPRTYKVEATIPNIYTITVTNNSNINLNSDFIVQNGKITTNPIVILSNTNNTDIDLGLKELKSSLSGLAWCDTNGDGLRNVGEPLIDSLIIKLLTTDGTLVSRDTTNANGEYSFDNVSVGKYFIQFDTIIGKYFSKRNQGLDPNVDSDIIPTDGRTDTLIVTSGISMEHLDAGYIPYSAIGDFVWIDSNKNGLQEQNENGINGIWIKLLNNSGVVLDSVLSSTKNGKSGYYYFKNLTFGSYIIQFPLPQNFEYTIKVASDSILNSDIIDINTGKTDLIYVSPGQIRTDIDAGYILITTSNGSISGLAWQDIDNNKLRELNEPILAGISITLFSISGSIISTTISATDGTYSFSDIPFGDYYISAVAIENKPFVLYLGTPSNMDSDISNEFGIGTTRLINVLPGANITNIDIGYYATMSIGDFVWDDLNNNGLQESGEPGLAGILVSLIDESGTVRKTVISDSTGKYLIDSVATGRYKLSFGSRPGYVHAINNPADVIRNSKADVSTGVTPLLDFLVAQAYTDVDAGYVRTGSIGDRVWLDLNGNGFFQMGEPGIANVKIYLYSSTGLLVDSTLSVTEPNGEFAGYYIFTNVRPGTYYVKFNIPSNYLISPAGIGGDDDDSNITEENGPLTTGNFVVGPGQFVFNIDAAAYLPATIGDRVWDDINKNGVQDPSEPGIGGIGVKIFTQNGILVDTTTTNSQGIYSFSGLRQRLYYLQFTIRDGFEFTLINASGSSSTDSDVDPTGTTPLISLAHGSILLDIDAGMHRSNNRLVMGTIWNDYNKDGIRTEDEKLQNGIRVHLKDMLLGSVKTYTTNHAGMYCLSTPTEGEHRVVVEAPDDHVFTAKKMGVSREFDSDVNEDGESENLMLDEKYKMDYIDAGFYFKVISSINGLVWKDANKNGYRDDKDLPIPNIVIFLFNQDKIFVKSTKSNDRGEYSLKHLTPGKYYCSLPQFPDLDFVMFTGANQEKDSEFTNQYGIGTTRLVTIDPGIPLLNFDFGYKELTNFNSDENNRQVIGVYPNPAVNELRVKAPPSEEPYEFVVVNNQGFAIKKGFLTNNENALDVGHLPPGRYTLHVSTSKGVIIKSFIKIDN